MPTPASVYWEADSNWSLDRMVADPHKTSYITNWENTRRCICPTSSWRTPLSELLSTDGTYAFVVEDLLGSVVAPAQK